MKGPKHPQTAHALSTEMSRAPANRWRSGSASNSPDTKRLQPSRTNGPFTRAERAWMEVAYVGKQICESSVTWCRGIIVGTASPSDEPLVNYHMPVSHISSVYVHYKGPEGKSVLGLTACFFIYPYL